MSTLSHIQCRSNQGENVDKSIRPPDNQVSIYLRRLRYNPRCIITHSVSPLPSSHLPRCRLSPTFSIRRAPFLISFRFVSLRLIDNALLILTHAHAISSGQVVFARWRYGRYLERNQIAASMLESYRSRISRHLSNNIRARYINNNLSHACAIGLTT